ncbi:MAG TPA: flagellar basal-body rod protein FlgF [Gammaproteobacteria bacterium]|nr:flagellar basal-body rod protein FlgF [Gammaproteobacteria bacterium]
MDRMLYVAMTGAKQTMLAQTANSNNLANANTNGFRADLAAFRSMPVYGPGEPTRVYAMAESTGVDTTAGAITPTGRDLDIAVNGEGWIAVQAPDGSEAYTRVGNLQIGDGGILQTGSGLQVLGNGGPVALPPFEKVEIGADGTISVRGIGQSASTLTVLDRIKLVRIDAKDLAKGEDGLLRMRDGSNVSPDASVSVVSGALETSNVNTVEAMVNLISLARQYEAQVNLMKTAEETDTAATQLLSITG